MEKTAADIRREVLSRFPDIAKIATDDPVDQEKTAAVLTMQARKHIKPKNFALPKKKAYPIEDLAHARNALSRAAQNASPATEAKIRQKVYSKYPGLKERAKETHEKAASKVDSFAVEHPYLSTLVGPEVAGTLGSAVLGPGGGILALPAEIAGTHYLSKGLKEKRERAGAKGKPKSFALRHPYFTGMGSRMAGGLAGAGVGGLAGYGIGKAVGGGNGIDLPGVGRVGGREAGALLGAALGSITGRALGTRAIMKGQERELEGAEKSRKKSEKKASLGDPIENLTAMAALGESLAEQSLEPIRKLAAAEATRILMAHSGQTKTASAEPTTLQDFVQRESDESLRILAKLGTFRRS